MSDTPNPDLNPELPLDVTQAAVPAPSARSHTEPAADITTDFDESDSAPSGRSGPPAAPARSPAVNRLVADYQLQDKLGEGGMGRVYKAIDPNGRAVAIKLLSPHLTSSDEALQRFKQEGVIASQINHPHCVFVHRVDDDRGTPYIAMELMTGKTLKDLVQKQGALPYKESVRLILQCIDGLIEAHRLGMIHRDIKPANCYLDDDGNVKIGDFGLARSLVDDSELTRTGAFLGTPLFASPEQLLGHKIDERSDIYSLSATLYFLLAGRAPFESPNAAQVIAKIASSDPPPLKESQVTVPAALESVVMHGLARDRAKRFESFQKMRAALLPLMEPEREIASLPRRAVATFLDWCIFSVLYRIFLFALTSVLQVTLIDMRSWPVNPSLLAWLLYLWLFEWRLGWTIGKRIVKLRVDESQAGMPQSAQGLLLRAGIFVAATEVVGVVVHVLYGPLPDSRGALVNLLGFVVGTCLVMATWWRSGRRQLTHEWFSQTVTCLATPQRTSLAAQLEIPDWRLPLVSDAKVPELLGRFAIKGQLKTSNDDQWLLAHDVNLDREVWIHWLSAGAPPITLERKNCTLRTRMRVIESGLELNRHWDAFLAPDGVPLSAIIENGGHVPWPVAQQLIGEILSEGDLSSTQLQTNDPWNADRYYLDATGRLTFAEADLGSGAKPNAYTQIDLMQQVALAALPARHGVRERFRSKKPVGRSTIDAATIPPYSGLKLLEGLARKRLNLTQVANAMDAIKQRADHVSPSMRFVHAATVTMLLTPLLLVILIVFIVNNSMRAEMRSGNYRLLRAISTVLSSPDDYPSAFAQLTPEQTKWWFQPDRISQVNQMLDMNMTELQIAMAHSHPLERAIYIAMGADPAVLDENLLPPKGQAVSQDNVESSEVASSVTVNAPIPISVGGLRNKTVLLDTLLLKAEKSEDLWRPVRLPSAVASTRNLCVVFALLTLWVGLSRGGLIQMLTGVCVVCRDGCRISMLRAWLRGVLLFAPFVLLAWTIMELESEGVQWLWLTLQLKIIICLLPAFYLVGALIWPQMAPHDRLCQTVVVPR